MLKPFLFLNEMVIKIGHRRNYLSSIPFMFLDIPDLKELETRLQIKLFYVKRIIYNGNEMVMQIRHRRNHLPSIHFMFFGFPRPHRTWEKIANQILYFWTTLTKPQAYYLLVAYMQMLDKYHCFSIRTVEHWREVSKTKGLFCCCCCKTLYIWRNQDRSGTRKKLTNTWALPQGKFYSLTLQIP